MPETPLPKILIVDDEAAHVRALCDTLSDHGYETVGFSSPHAALAELPKAEFDLLLSDLMMPEMSGIELLQAALKVRPNLVGIIMTGEGTIATAVASMKSGALDYILKPFKLSAVLPVLERALAVRRLRLQNEMLERQVRERTAQLEAANQELEAFSFSVSHDLRAPLRHIDSYARLIGESDPSLSEETRRYADLVSGAAARMSQLIEDLLNFSRNSRAEIRKTRVNLQEMFNKTMEELKSETNGRNISWKIGPLGEVAADAALLQQVVSNLLLNAVKYTRQRDLAEIEIGCLDDSGHEATVFVKDNGAGFDMQYADKLFGVFQRLHHAHEFEGTGIGLATVRRIIARHGGRTWGEGKVDAGATFYFTLPRP
jgi:two-component system sensor histidine kinase/response regulator